jgi:hypothetical protein
MTRRNGGAPDVSDALRSLPVPEHGDDFFDRLRATLASDAPAPPASAVTELSAVRLAKAAPRRRLHHFLALATAPAAAVACFVLVVGVGLLARERGSSVSDVTANRLTVPVQPAKAARGLRVRFTKTEESPRHSSQTYDAVISPAGDYRMSRTPAGLDLAYDSASGVRTMSRFGGSDERYVAQRDLPPGPPDGPELSQPNAGLSRDLGAGVRAIAAESPSRVQEITYNGRAALELLTQTPGVPFDTQRLVVDTLTGYPLLVLQTKAGKPYREMTVETIAEVPLGEHEFDVASTPMATLQRQPDDESLKFETTALRDVAAKAGYTPLVATHAPSGYTLVSVRVAASVERKDNQRNPTSRDVVALLYRKGLDSFTVTTRRADGDAGTYAPWVDPLTDGKFTNTLQTDPASVRSGALAGVPLNVGVNALGWPHLWAHTDALVVTVAGDLTRTQLLDVTGSLEQYVPLNG